MRSVLVCLDCLRNHANGTTFRQEKMNYQSHENSIVAADDLPEIDTVVISDVLSIDEHLS
jgi:hypothetical protein